MMHPIKAVTILFISLCTLKATTVSTLVHSGTLVTIDPEQPEAFIGYFTVDEDGRITEVSEGEPPADIEASETIDATGKIIIPGFLSGHSHLWQSAFRGLARDQYVWGWIQQLHFVYGPHFEAGDPFAFTKHGALDQLRHGITSTYNHAHNLNYSPEINTEQFYASLDTPQRFIYGFGFNRSEDVDTRFNNLRSFVDTVSPLAEADDRVLRLSIYGHMWPEEIETHRRETELVKELGLSVQIHCLESPVRSPVERLSIPKLLEAGKFHSDLTMAHFIHVTPEVLQVAADNGAAMVWNPLSNGRLGSGFADIPTYLEAGLEVAMGVDGQASADLSDPFQNMRMGLYSVRMHYTSADIMDPLDILRLHTLETAKALGVDADVGSLETGKFADFLIVDSHAALTGPIFDPVATLVFVCSASNIETVHVGGKMVVEKGDVIGVDEEVLGIDIQTRIDRLKLAAENAEPAKHF